MTWRPLTDNGVKQTNVLFDSSGEIVFRTQQNVAPVLDNNHVLRNHEDRGYTHSKDMRRVASIPVVLIEQWLRDDGLDIYNPDHADRLMKKLNDPDYAYLRTAPGHLGPTGDGNFR